MTAQQISEAPEIAVLASADQDIHAIFRSARKQSPVASNSMGVAIALRGRHLETVNADANRQVDTKTKAMQASPQGRSTILMSFPFYSRMAMRTLALASRWL